MKNLNEVQTGLEVFCLYEKVIIKDIANNIVEIDFHGEFIKKDISKIFLPSPYIELISRIISDAKRIFLDGNTHIISGSIWDKFEKHWIALCNIEEEDPGHSEKILKMMEHAEFENWVKILQNESECFVSFTKDWSMLVLATACKSCM